jgi:hypothetical protein
MVFPYLFMIFPYIPMVAPYIPAVAPLIPIIALLPDIILFFIIITEFPYCYMQYYQDTEKYICNMILYYFDMAII